MFSGSEIHFPLSPSVPFPLLQAKSPSLFSSLTHFLGWYWPGIGCCLPSPCVFADYRTFFLG